MDPTQTLRDILTALDESEDGFSAEAADRARDLLDWLDKGGFDPKLTPDQTRRILRVWLEDVITYTPGV